MQKANGRTSEEPTVQSNDVHATQYNNKEWQQGIKSATSLTKVQTNRVPNGVNAKPEATKCTRPQHANDQVQDNDRRTQRLSPGQEESNHEAPKHVSNQVGLRDSGRKTSTRSQRQHCRRVSTKMQQPFSHPQKCRSVQDQASARYDQTYPRNPRIQNHVPGKFTTGSDLHPRTCQCRCMACT